VEAARERVYAAVAGGLLASALLRKSLATAQGDDSEVPELCHSAGQAVVIAARCSDSDCSDFSPHSRPSPAVVAHAVSPRNDSESHGWTDKSDGEGNASSPLG
jgi:hypothetical protein